MERLRSDTGKDHSVLISQPWKTIPVGMLGDDKNHNHCYLKVPLLNCCQQDRFMRFTAPYFIREGSHQKMGFLNVIVFHLQNQNRSCLWNLVSMRRGKR
jgi:hypothetical protein